MTSRFSRREFLVRLWRGLAGLGVLAGGWTSWDLLQPRGSTKRGPVRTVTPSEVPDVGVLEVRAIGGYLTKIEGDVVALNWRCPHLGCKVPWCESSGQFECPCHGSVFNRAGEYRRGPSPRGLDSFAMSIEDGVVVVDTGAVATGEPPGSETLDEPVKGPECLESEV